MWSVVTLGRGVGKREPALRSCSSFSPLHYDSFRVPSAPLSSPVPLPGPSQYPIVSLRLSGPGPVVLATPQALATVVASSCLKQLWWPPPKVAVDQQQMKTKGLFIAGWPWGLEQGLEQGLRPGEAQ